MAEFSFDTLTPEVETLPKREGGRQRKIQHNPFVAWVQESYDTKTGRSVTIPNEQVKDAEYLIRAAAADLGIGVRVAVLDAKTGEKMSKEARDSAPKNKNIKVVFQGKEKRKYNGRKTQDNAGTDAPAQ